MHTDPATPRPRRLWLIALGLVALVAVSVMLTLWVARTWLYPQPIAPVVLDAGEQAVLDAKLARLEVAATEPVPDVAPPDTETLAPERYREDPADRVLRFSQRELNALIARNPDLAGRLALHLDDDHLSATMLIDVPRDFPVFAERRLRVSTGLTLRHEHGRPVIAIEGVSLMGVPLPSAWLGGLKGRNLVEEFDAAGGFWHAVGEGVNDLRVENGQLRIELAE